MPHRPTPNRRSATRSPARTTPSSPWLGVLAGLLWGAVLVAGCSKKAGPSTAPDAAVAEEPAADEPAAGFEHDAHPTIDDGLSGYVHELAGYEDELLAVGVSLPDPVSQARTEQGRSSLPAADGGGDVGGPRCERICGLATNICGLRDRICGLVDEHRDDLRYQRVCERATHDCARATEACEGCDG